MKLEFYNCPKPSEIFETKLPTEVSFLNYEPNWELLEKTEEKYQQFKNILIIGNGGSINSFYGFYYALNHEVKKQAYFLSTVDPDYIQNLKAKLNPKDTLVIVASKSGETTTVLEALSQFMEYKLLMITGKISSLRAVGEKLGADIITHPSIGGRFTGFTEVGLMPAAIVGLDYKKLFFGAKNFYSLYEKENLAWKAASIFYQLERKGFTDVFMPFYSHSLFATSLSIIQLCHESFGKDGKGQTYFALEAPESQHHTNQRFFGGTKNICGFFTALGNFRNNLIVNYPTTVHSIQFKGHPLFDINNIPFSKSMEFEVSGTIEDARIAGLPIAYLTLSALTAEKIGSLLAFWQLFSVYSSVLRQVDPFNQPQVENSKVISFNKRLQFKGLL